MRALEARYATIDHIDGYVEALAREGASGSQMFGLNLTSVLDESRIPSLVEATRKAGVWIVPTEALFQHWLGPDDPETMRAWPEMQYVPQDQLAQWVESKTKLMAGATPAERARFLEVRGRLIRALHAGGLECAGLLGTSRAAVPRAGRPHAVPGNRDRHAERGGVLQHDRRPRHHCTG
jgi:hypothetical protein